MEHLLLCQMGMDGMASGNSSIWQMCLRFQHLSQSRGHHAEWGETHPVLYLCRWNSMQGRSVYSLLSAHWKLRSRKWHSPKANPPNTRKGQGSDEWMLSGQGGKNAASLFQSTSKIWLPGRTLYICMYLCTAFTRATTEGTSNFHYPPSPPLTGLLRTWQVDLWIPGQAVGPAVPYLEEGQIVGSRMQSGSVQLQEMPPIHRLKALEQT